MGYLAVTGITGKSGSVFAEHLKKNEDKVRAMFPEGIRLLTHKRKGTVFDFTNLEICEGDLTDRAYIKEALKGVDTLVHIAGIHWSREVVDAAAASGVRRLICVHTTGIYSKYKEAGEEYRQIDDYVYGICKENNILLTILRPTMIYGNSHDMNVIKFIKMVDRLPIMPVVNGARYDLQPVNYRDLGAAYYAVLVNGKITAGRDYVLSGKEPVQLRDMFKIIGDELGKTVRFVSVPFFIAYPGAVAIYYISLKKIDFREKVQRLCEPRAYDHDEATADFGYAPMNFNDGIKDEIREYRGL